MLGSEPDAEWYCELAAAAATELLLAPVACDSPLLIGKFLNSLLFVAFFYWSIEDS